MSKRPRPPKVNEAYIAFADDPKDGGFYFKATFKRGFQKDSAAHHHCRLVLDYLNGICKVTGMVKEEAHMDDGTIITPPTPLILLPPGVNVPETQSTN